MHGPLSIVEQHQLQWHCRQLCDTGIGMLGLAKMHHAQKGIQAEVIHLSALANSHVLGSIHDTGGWPFEFSFRVLTHLGSVRLY